MGKYRPAVLLGLTLLVALVTSILAYRWLQRTAGKSSPDIVQVAVATTDLAWGTPLTGEAVKMVPYFRKSLPSGAVTSEAALPGRVVTAAVRANEPILESKLAPTTIQGGGVAAIIAPNKRAMAVKVDKVKGVSGFIKPGHRVDVLVSLKQAGEGNNNPVTKIVLQNIPVLAIGPETEDKEKKGKPSPVDVITLEVTPEEAEKLALASAEGKLLQLALRNYTDTENVPTRGITVPAMLDLGGGEVKKAAAPAKRVVRPAKTVAARAPTPPVPQGPTVELIRGSSVRQLHFKGDE